MTLQLFAHPFSSYCQKVLISLYENDTPFEFRMLGPEEKRNLVEFAKLSPMRRMPVLVDGDRAVVESSVIIEYLDLHHPGAAGRHLACDAARVQQLLGRQPEQQLRTVVQLRLHGRLHFPRGVRVSDGESGASHSREGGVPPFRARVSPAPPSFPCVP